MSLARSDTDAARRRRDQIAALSAQRQYEGAARANRSLATELRSRRFATLADQLDAAADIAARAARRETFLEDR